MRAWPLSAGFLALVLAALALGAAACDSDDEGGPPGGSDAAVDAGRGGGDGGTRDAGADVDAQTSCLPSGACEDGPSCGDACCGAGERCVAGTCMCGNAPGCTGGDSCAPAGPVGKDNCGAVCCGATGPCPQ